MAGDNNLELASVDSEDLDTLASKIEDYYKSDATTKSQLAWSWERNHLMLDGKQWLVFDGNRDTGGVWRELKVSKENEYIPRPTTNYIFSIYQTLKSYLIKNKPRSTVRPNTQTSRDKSSAKIAELCIETNYERLKEQYNYEYAAACLLTYGTVFKKDYWDTSSISMIKVPKMIQQPQMDPQTGAMIGMTEVQATDPETGEPQFDKLPLGDVNTSIVEPYRMALDPLATDLHNLRWIMEYSIQPLDLVKEVCGKEGPGYTGRIDEVKAETSLPGSMQRFYQLKNSSGVKAGLNITGEGNQQGGKLPDNHVVLKEYYERPSIKYPNGRLIIVANGVCLYAGDSPYEGPDMGDWHPYSDCRWEIVPGRFWGRGPIDDCVEIQKQVNSIDSVITLTRKTMAIPQKLIPIGCGIAPGSMTGRPGQENFYRADPSGAKPEIIPPVGVSEQVFQERAQKVEDIKECSGAIDILKGDRPPGVTAASALNLLYEVGTGKLFPILDRWKCCIESSQKKQLRLIAKRYKEPREAYIKMLMMRNKELSPESIQHFLGEDLYDNCNVVVEAGSNIPKLQAAKQAQLQEAAQTGALHLENPLNAMEYQRQMGITGFDTDLGPDVKRAEWENDMLDDTDLSPDNKPIVLVYDDHKVHQKVHSDRMKEPSFMSLSPGAQQAYMAHMQEHEQFEQQAQQAAMIQQMAAGGMPGQPQPPGAPGMPMQGHGQASPAQAHSPSGPGVGRGKGTTKNIQNALHSDMLQAAGPGASQ